MMTKIKNNIKAFPGYAVFLKKMSTYCFVGTGILFALYMYVVGSITFSVVERKGLEETNRNLLSDIGMQELRYLAQEKRLTKEVAYSTGLIDAKSLVFTTKQSAFAWNAGR
ncbi:MAG: hypothetical protein KBC11_00190 [Candidatus Pacebacteria bacterium]|nr:hypothetical protein [Candidatus Paceibacterota bacterium]